MHKGISKKCAIGNYQLSSCGLVLDQNWPKSEPAKEKNDDGVEGFPLARSLQSMEKEHRAVVVSDGSVEQS